MYDPWGTYMTIEEAIKVGRELEKLDYYWYEHPMPEYRVESYVRLGRELSIPILSPEIVAGGVFSRADWMLRGAGDMSRIDVMRGGITGARKTAIVCEAYGIRCEIHMAGWGNLQVLGATSEDTSEYYEKGLMAPGVDIDAPDPYLAARCDLIDGDGYVHLPTLPRDGLRHPVGLHRRQPDRPDGRGAALLVGIPTGADRRRRQPGTTPPAVNAAISASLKSEAMSRSSVLTSDREHPGQRIPGISTSTRIGGIRESATLTVTSTWVPGMPSRDVPHTGQTRDRRMPRRRGAGSSRCSASMKSDPNSGYG